VGNAYALGWLRFGLSGFPSMKKLCLFFAFFAAARADFAIHNATLVPVYFEVSPYSGGSFSAFAGYLAPGARAYFAHAVITPADVNMSVQALTGTFVGGETATDSIGFTTLSAAYSEFLIMPDGYPLSYPDERLRPSFVASVLPSADLWPIAWQAMAIGVGCMVVPATISMAMRAVRRGLTHTVSPS